MPTAEVTLPGLASSIPTARRFVESVLTGWGQPDLGWTAAQIVSELATNCAIHARTDFSIQVLCEDSEVRLEVKDGSPVTVHPRSYSDTATTGRGLRMVDMLASGWGVALRPEGKTVWVSLKHPHGDEDTDDLLARFGDDVPAVVPMPTRAPQRGVNRAAA